MDGWRVVNIGYDGWMGVVSIGYGGMDDHFLGFLTMFHSSATLPEGMVIYWYFS